MAVSSIETAIFLLKLQLEVRGVGEGLQVCDFCSVVIAIFLSEDCYRFSFPSLNLVVNDVDSVCSV